MSSPKDHFLPAQSTEIVDAIAFALRYSGRKRVHDSSEIMAGIVAKRLAEHLERSGFVMMKRPPLDGSSPRLAPARREGEA